ncbi:hypothetical protein KIN20_029850 [Parelaphostrongylus tenuis]|uniref:Uncharacterized protein n=1 Tax=Parelaphostrongylus tenuis TaxID=148309 RepID=A0AAD5R2Z0_PARTN|nr:hypothetical protein KIN20_029850 [Parelaphostrongylus tenuis]
MPMFRKTAWMDHFTRTGKKAASRILVKLRIHVGFTIFNKHEEQIRQTNHPLMVRATWE